MYFKKIDDNDYNMISEWWKARNHWQVPKAALSPVGFLAYSDTDEPLAAGWLYLTDGSTVALIGWITTNPSSALKSRYKAVNMVLDCLINVAKHYERKEILMFSGSNSLSKLAKKRNMTFNKPHDFYIGVL